MTTPFIRTKLEEVIYAFSVAKQIPIAFQNTKFKPSLNAPWLRVTLLPATTVGATACANEHKGILQIDVFTLTDKGPYSAEQLATEIALAFKRGSNFEGVYIPQPPSIGASRNDGEWYQTPIDIIYQLIA